MGVHVSKPTVIYGDYLSAITNTVNLGSQLKKKYLALAYHFCRENFGARIVQIRKIDRKDNYADPFTKASFTYEFHEHMKEIMERTTQYLSVDVTASTIFIFPHARIAILLQKEHTCILNLFNHPIFKQVN